MLWVGKGCQRPAGWGLAQLTPPQSTGNTEAGAPHLLLVQQLLQAGLVLRGLRVRQELQVLNLEGL